LDNLFEEAAASAPDSPAVSGALENAAKEAQKAARATARAAKKKRERKALTNEEKAKLKAKAAALKETRKTLESALQQKHDILLTNKTADSRDVSGHKLRASTKGRGHHETVFSFYKAKPRIQKKNEKDEESEKRKKTPTQASKRNKIVKRIVRG
jgi:hypothetical protein